MGLGTRKGQLQAWALVPTVLHPRESEPLPTAKLKEPPTWLWQVPVIVMAVLIAFLTRWVWVP